MLGQHTGQRCQQHIFSAQQGSRPHARAAPAAPQQPAAHHAAASTSRRQQAHQPAGRRSLRAHAAKAGEIGYEELVEVAREAAMRGQKVTTQLACLKQAKM